MGSIELDNILRESLFGLEYFIEFSSTHEGHDEVKSFRRLKQEFHANEEGMLALQEDFLLQLGVLHLVVFNKDIFANSLNSVLQTSGFKLS